METHLETKFYAPEISEFYVGFEYEIKPWNRGESDNSRLDWVKCDDLNNWNLIYTDDANPLFELEDLIKSGWVRIKYLDKDDIEELGFKLEKDTTDGIVFYYKFINGEISIEYGNWFVLGSKDSGIKMDYEKATEHRRIKIKNIEGNFTLFNGTVKNKSELKKLLTQLGIEYNK